MQSGARKGVGVEIAYQDGDSEDIFLDELVQLVDIETLAQEAVEMSIGSGTVAAVPEHSAAEVPSSNEAQQDVSEKKLPFALTTDRCFHKKCTRTATFGFEGKAPILCAKHSYQGKKYAHFETTPYGQVAIVKSGPKPKNDTPMTSTQRGAKFRENQKEHAWCLNNNLTAAQNTAYMAVSDLEVSNELVKTQQKEIKKLKRRLQEAQLERDSWRDQARLYKELYESRKET